MSRHRAYQNYDYENDLDEYDGDEYAEEEENELSPEDKLQMAEGTAEVRRLLATQAQQVTTQQIQEALWHYYYDVDKTVAYLINKFIDPASKTGSAKSKGSPPKQTPSSDGKLSPRPFLSSVNFPSPTGVSEADCWRACATGSRPNSTTVSFFADMPWMNIPEHRRAVFVAPPRPRGGLLGGSSGGAKMSKLQALAVARKKKTQETKKVEGTSLLILSKEAQCSHAKGTPRADAPVACDMPSATEKPAVQLEAAHETASDPRASGLESGIVNFAPPASRKRPYSTTLDGTVDDDLECQKGSPSAFAQALLPFASGIPLAYRRLYPLPWMLHTSIEALQDVFEKPSPDDVVLAAQSQAGRSVNKGR